MAVRTKLPDKEEPIDHKELDYVQVNLYTTNDSKPETESVDGLYRRDDMEIFRICDKCGAEDRDEEVTLYAIRKLGHPIRVHLCGECLGSHTDHIPEEE